MIDTTNEHQEQVQTVKGLPSARFIIGATMVLAGLVYLAEQSLHTGWLFFLFFPLFGAVLLLPGFVLQRFGLVVAGAILTGVGAGMFVLLTGQVHLGKLGRQGEEEITADEVAGWPEGGLDFFVNQRLFSPTTPANSLECDGCEERCFMTVCIPPPDAPITRQPFIICNQRDDIGRVIIAPDRLKRWKVDLGRLAGVLSDLLGIDQSPHELICQRLWDLGKVDLESGMSEVFLARGLDWTDAEETLGNDLGVKEAVAPLVFTPGRTSRRFLPHASIFSVTRMLRVQKGRLVLDRDGIARAMAEKAKREVLTGNVFRKAGQFWTISYEGKTFSLQDSRGLQYIAFLLASPGEEFHAQRIQSEVEGKFPLPGYSEATKMSEQDMKDYLTYYPW